MNNMLENNIEDFEKIEHFIKSFDSILEYKEFLNILLINFLELTDGRSGFIIIKDIKNNNFKVEKTLHINENYSKNVLYDIIVYVQLVFQNSTVKIINSSDFIDDESKEKKAKILIPLAVNNTVYAVILINNVEIKDPIQKKLNIIQLLSTLCSQVLAKILFYHNLIDKINLKDMLIDISNSLEKVFSLKDAFDLIMEKIAVELNIIRGILVVFDKDDKTKLSIFSGYSCTEEEISRGIYKVGEGIIGKVVETLKPFSIPDINADKLFLNRMKIKRSKNTPISFIAVPIIISGKIFGVLAVEKFFESLEKLKDEEETMMMISGTIQNKALVFEKMSYEKKILIEENIFLKQELQKNYGMDNIIGKSKDLLKIFEIIRMVADSNSSVLIVGESGTGKELIAKALHFNSLRRDKPFVSINCAAIPENLLEAELFGYKKGSYTGAVSDKKGKFLLADGGTIFLDEISEMPVFLQSKLLRAIQEKEIEPIGAEEKVSINIRVISASNKEPKELVENGFLRSDLYYRLNVIEINIPNLRERRDDIPLLIQHFIDKYSKKNNREVDGITHEALRILKNYHWPGNVRELENIIERAILLTKTRLIDVVDIPWYITETNTAEKVNEKLNITKWIENFINNKNFDGNALQCFMNVFEKELLSKVLLSNKRNKIQTAKFLGINRNTLRAKMKQYGIV